MTIGNNNDNKEMDIKAAADMNEDNREKNITVWDIELSNEIFRSYDIRGVADIDPLDPEVKRAIDLSARQAWLVGKAYGTWVKNSSGSKIVIGRDNRRTSLDLAAGFSTGALSTGCNVVDIGLATTPLLYFAVEEFGCQGGVMVTGSHNPMWSNGLKLCKSGYRTLVGNEIQSLFELIKRKDFKHGSGSYKEDSIIEIYLNAIKERVKPAHKPLNIVIDSGNATGGLFAPRLLSDLGYKVVAINSDLKYPFPKGSPDPEQPSKVRELGQKVKGLGADVGIAYDGDADRVGIVDENGHKIESDLLLLFLARNLLEDNPGVEIIFDVKCSDLLIVDIKNRGGIPVMWKTGHSNIKQKMTDDVEAGKPALLGGELSGHIFFRDRFYGFDDAIYVSCRVLEILSRSEKSISEILDDLPKLKTTRELGLPCPDNKKDDVINSLLKKFRVENFNVIDLDGVRIDFGLHKWALVRASNTQPKLTARFQAKDSKTLAEIIDLVRVELQKFNFVDVDDLDAGFAEVVD